MSRQRFTGAAKIWLISCEERERTEIGVDIKDIRGAVLVNKAPAGR